MTRMLAVSLLLLNILNVNAASEREHWQSLANLPKNFNWHIVAYWNETLYMMYYDQLYYSPFTIHDVSNVGVDKIELVTPMDWKQMTLPPTDLNGTIYYESEYYKSGYSGHGMFWLYSHHFTMVHDTLYGSFVNHANDMLLFNLSTLSFVDMSLYDYDLVERNLGGPGSMNCFTNNDSHLFVIGKYSAVIQIYDITNDLWSASNAIVPTTTVGPACAITSDKSRIYYFGGQTQIVYDYISSIVRYNIWSDTIYTLNETLIESNSHFYAINIEHNRMLICGKRRLFIEIFNYNTETIQAIEIVDYFYPGPLYHKTTDSIIMVGGGTDQLDDPELFDQRDQISYIPSWFSITMSDDIFNLNYTHIIHSGILNSASCLMFSAPLQSTLIISSDFTQTNLDFSLYLDDLNACGYPLSQYKSNSESIVDTKDTFSIAIDHRDYIESVVYAQICHFHLYFATDTIYVDEMELNLWYNVSSCNHDRIPYGIELQYIVDIIVNNYASEGIRHALITMNGYNYTVGIKTDWKFLTFESLLSGALSLSIDSHDPIVIGSSSTLQICDVIDFSNSSVSMKPGDFFFIKYDMVNLEHCHHNKSYVIDVTAYDLQIVKKVVIKKRGNIHICYLCDESTYKNAETECDLCNNEASGIKPAIVQQKKENDTYQIQLSTDDAVLLFSNIQISLIRCDSGYTSDSEAVMLECKSCGYNTFSFDGISLCYHCTENANQRYQCLGKNTVQLDADHWISAKYKTENAFYPLYHIDNDASIYSSVCPPRQCCVNKNGCDYYANYMQWMESETSELCAKGRNLSTVLCSKCMNGLYELLGSKECGICNENNPFYLSIVILCAIMFSLYIAFIYSRSYPMWIQHKEINWRKLLIKDDWFAIRLIVFKIMMYFYQSLSQILSTKGLNPANNVESFLLSIFSFDINSVNMESAICFISNIDSVLKEIMISFIFYGFVVGSMILIFVVHVVVRRLNLKWYRAQPYIKMGIINIMIMVCGSLLSTSFKLITCVHINHHYVHFYDATLECYDSYWFLGLFLLVFIAMFWAFLLYLMKKQTVKERQNEEQNEYSRFSKPFLTHCWWWEFVLFSRRFLIAGLTAGGYALSEYSNLLLGVTIFVFVVLHSLYSPFIYKKCNYLELVSLFGLGSIVMSVNFINTNIKFISILVTILIAFPCVITAIFVMKLVYRLINIIIIEKEVDYDVKLKHIEAIKKRAPESFRKWLEKDAQRSSVTVNTVSASSAPAANGADSFVDTELGELGDLKEREQKKSNLEIKMQINGQIKLSQTEKMEDADSSSSSSALEDESSFTLEVP